jgi:transposase-like protein
VRAIQAFLSEMYGVEVSPDLIATSPTPSWRWWRGGRRADAALLGLDDVERGPWGVRFPTVVAAWCRAWTHVMPFFAFPPEVRRVRCARS